MTFFNEFLQLYLCSLYQMKVRGLPIAFGNFRLTSSNKFYGISAYSHSGYDPLQLRMNGTPYTGASNVDVSRLFGIKSAEWRAFIGGIVVHNELEDSYLDRIYNAKYYARNILLTGRFMSPKYFAPIQQALPHIHTKLLQISNIP